MLCVGEVGDDPNAPWKNIMKWYSENNSFKELNRIDGMQTEYIARIHDVGHPRRDSKIDEKYTV